MEDPHHREEDKRTEDLHMTHCCPSWGIKPLIQSQPHLLHDAPGEMENFALKPMFLGSDADVICTI